jgi:hypothetical protein
LFTDRPSAASDWPAGETGVGVLLQGTLGALMLLPSFVPAHNGRSTSFNLCTQTCALFLPTQVGAMQFVVSGR